MHVEIGDLARQKELTGGQESNHIHRVMSIGAWLSAIPHHHNGTELSQEELRDNLCLIFGLMPHDIPVTCDGCGNKLLIKHALLCPNCGLIIERHDDAAKEWDALRVWALFPIAITYEHKINIRTVQGERTGAEARQEEEVANDGADTVGEAQGSRVRTVNGAARLL